MTFKEALKLLKPYRKRMTLIMSLALLISGISAVTPFLNRRMIDYGLLQGDVPTITRMAALIAALLIAGQIIEYLQKKQEIAISNDLGKRLKTEAFEHGLKLKASHFKEHGFYKTVSDALYDISNIMMIANSSFLLILVVICRCAGALVGLLILDWRLSLFVLAMLPVKIVINTAIRKRAERQGEALMNDSKEYNSWLSGMLSGITDIKLWNLRGKVSAEYAGHVETINESSKRLSLLRAKSGLLTMGFEYAWMNAIYILGGILIARRWLTFGGLIAFISFTAYVLSPVNVIMELRVILKQITPSAESLKRYNALEEEGQGAKLPPPNKPSLIEMRGVSVSLDGQDILKDVRLAARRGEKIAIVGDNGSGKTTLINVLLRLLEPDSGEVLIDGIPASEYEIDGYRLMFSVVSQDVHLFNGTARYNVTFDGGAGSSQEIDGLPAFLTDAVESWEEGYDTPVGSEGAKLSGGERQKIALMRALHRKADILVLDEPTSNYDGGSDEDFNRFVRDDSGYGVYFIISHHGSVLSCVDKVFVLEGGRLTETDPRLLSETKGRGEA